MPFDATPIRAALPAPAVRLCLRLGEIQARLQAGPAPAERRALEAELDAAMEALAMANAHAALLRQPHA